MALWWHRIAYRPGALPGLVVLNTDIVEREQTIVVPALMVALLASAVLNGDIVVQDPTTVDPQQAHQPPVPLPLLLLVPLLLLPLQEPLAHAIWLRYFLSLISTPCSLMQTVVLTMVWQTNMPSLPTATSSMLPPTIPHLRVRVTLPHASENWLLSLLRPPRKRADGGGVSLTYGDITTALNWVAPMLIANSIVTLPITHAPLAKDISAEDQSS